MTTDLQPLFRALADPTRREILCLLAQGDMSISEVSNRFDMTRAAVRKHLAVLSDGGLVTVEPQGRKRVNRLVADGLRPAVDWLSYFDAFWDTRLDALNSLVEQKEQPDD